MFRFKEENSLAARTQESENIMAKWPGRIPIIMERGPSSRLGPLPKNKFLCPADYSVLQFLGCVRKKVQLPEDTAFFVFVNGTELVSGESPMTMIYECKKESDGFLYMTLSDQEVMGVN